MREVTSIGFDGTLVRSKSAQKGVIGVRESIWENSRKRFTVAHEIGHFVIPYHRLLKNVCGERIIDSYRSTLAQGRAGGQSVRGRVFASNPGSADSV